MKIGVIISTYNNPAWLEKTLWGYYVQTRPADEIIIADDGSTQETKELLDSFKSLLPIKHIWHEDRGFNKTIILNKAIVAAESEYLIFTDQDCIPRKNFVKIHEIYAKKGCYVAARYYYLSPEASEKITKEDILYGRIFKPSWMLKNGFDRNSKTLKLMLSEYSIITRCLDVLSKKSPTWWGCNASCWRDDIFSVNGYDNGILYGREDYEFGLRLINNGIKPIKAGYSAIVFHLYHERPYENAELVTKHLAYANEVKLHGVKETPNGIKELDKIGF